MMYLCIRMAHMCIVYPAAQNRTDGSDLKKELTIIEYPVLLSWHRLK